MNLNQIVNMILRMLLRRGMNWGINKGIGMAANRGRKDKPQGEMTAQY